MEVPDHNGVGYSRGPQGDAYRSRLPFVVLQPNTTVFIKVSVTPVNCMLCYRD